MVKSSYKKILLFTDWYSPGYRAGGPIQSCANLVNHLKDSYQFFIVTSAYDYGSYEPYPNVKMDAWSKQEENVSICYLSRKSENIKFIKSLISQVNFDIIYLNSMFSIKYTVHPLRAIQNQLKHKKVILAPRGMLASGALSVKSKKKEFFLFFFKLLRIPSKLIFHATAEQELAYIKRTFGENVQVLLAPNLPAKSIQEDQQKVKYKKQLKLVCISRLSEEKNVNFILEILKNVKVMLSLDVFGSLKNERYVRDFKSKYDLLPENVKVNLQGEISNNEVREKIPAYDFFILPTLGENFGHAIYEALSAGLPVIISDKTPWRNLEENKAGWDLPLDNIDVWVEVLRKAAEMSEQEYREWSEGAKSFAEKAIDVDKIKNQYMELFG
jgi:glycosyltransferase involved in cell wall biosynthesis